MTHWGDPHSDDEYPDSTDSEGFTDIAAAEDSDYSDTEPLDSDCEYIIVSGDESSDEEEEANTPVLSENLSDQKATLRRTDTYLSRVQPKKVQQGGVEVQGLFHKCGREQHGESESH